MHNNIMYTHMFVHIYIYIHTYMYIYTHTYIHIHIYIYIYVHVYATIPLRKVSALNRVALSTASLHTLQAQDGVMY